MLGSTFPSGRSICVSKQAERSIIMNSLEDIPSSTLSLIDINPNLEMFNFIPSNGAIILKMIMNW